ncbi:hypothetical protein [Bacillus wiedmannii]|uniref:hypothetical protein n=1 Tax=Bacillus wiedmannii TaxID=1890302 RepID=UPI001CC20176|nr:hypothetical protein [Bacillus wiedmannii]
MMLYYHVDTELMLATVDRNKTLELLKSYFYKYKKMAKGLLIFGVIIGSMNQIVN